MAKPNSSKDQASRKRKPSTDTPSSKAPKVQKTNPSTSTPATKPLPSSHDAVLTDLKQKYDVLAAFTISSTKIQKRVTWLLQHLRKDDGDPRPKIVLLHARPSEVCKMITIAEQVKRIVADNGQRWYQYNQMYALPPKPKEKEVVEETVLRNVGSEEDDEDSDYFEVMDTRFERAVIQEPSPRPTLSLSIFLSLVQVPELRAREGVTMQSNELPSSSAPVSEG